MLTHKAVQFFHIKSTLVMKQRQTALCYLICGYEAMTKPIAAICIWLYTSYVCCLNQLTDQLLDRYHCCYVALNYEALLDIVFYPYYTHKIHWFLVLLKCLVLDL